jgi:mevalonate kinase
VALEQAIMFERGKDPDVVRVQKPKNSRFPWTFVLLDSGLRSPTINMVRQAEPFFRREGAKLIDEFDGITTACNDAFETGDVAMMAAAMKEAQLLLSTAGVVTPPLDDIASTATSVGALATKITGAGGGGCMLTLLVNERCDEQIAKLRERLGIDRVHPLFIP